MRLDDPTNNGGRGWRRFESDEIAKLAYLAIRLISKGVRNDLAGRNAARADEAARKIAEAVSARLASYPIFGPANPARGHSAGSKPDQQS